MSRKRDLNTRQKRFITAVAQGETYAAAYRAAGYADDGKPVTTRRNAQRLAKNAGVRASIEDMRRQLLPSPGDLREINEHAMAVIVRLSLEAEEEKVRLAAAEWLHEETGKQIAEREALEAGRGAQGANSPEVIIAELRALYAKALPGREPPLVEEVSDEMAVGQAGEAPAENLPQVAEPLVEVAAWAESARAEDEAPEPGESDTVKVSSVANPLKPHAQYRLERVPGFFPAKYRRVRVEP